MEQKVEHFHRRREPPGSYSEPDDYSLEPHNIHVSP